MKEIELKEMQEIEYEILVGLDAICEKQGFRYILTYGTLLGAVRHGGFIPWDDDVDIAMPRTDYNKFIKFIEDNKHEFPIWEIVNLNTQEKCGHTITRICDKRYYLEFEENKEWKGGLFVDIYPVDGLGNDIGIAKKMIKIGRFWTRCILMSSHDSLKYYKLGIKKITRYPIWKLCRIIGGRRFAKRIECLAKIYKFEKSDYVGTVTWKTDKNEFMYKREWFEKTEKIKFEKSMFRVPKDYHEMLKACYGDYMLLPPKEQQVGHHKYKVFSKEEFLNI